MKKKLIIIAAVLVTAAVVAGVIIADHKKPGRDTPAQTTTTSSQTTTSKTEPTGTQAPPAARKRGKLAGLYENDPSSVLAVGPRQDTFAALEDGTVWYAYWGDGGGAGFLNGEDDAYIACEEPVYAFDMKPRRMVVGQWSGFAVDENGTLWGWGSCVPGKRDYSVPAKLVRILDGVEDVQTAGEFSMALGSDGSLWIWGSKNLFDANTVIEDAVRIMDGVSSMGFASQNGAPIAVSSGVLYYFDENNEPHEVMKDVEAVRDGFVFGNDGALYVMEGTAAVKTAQDAVQASVSGQGLLIIEKDGDVVYSLDGKQTVISWEGAILIPAGVPIFIDKNQRLCAFCEGEVKIIDSDVICAASGVDGALVYAKSDRTLWLIQSLLSDKWYECPPRMIAPSE